MKNPNLAQNPHRRTSADNPQSSNTLEPEPSLFLRRRKTNRSSQRDNSEPVSPCFNHTKTRPTYHSGRSNKTNLEVKTNSATSSLSLGSRYPQNVSDWNEKVQRETRPGSGAQNRQAVDPPRLAKEGYEWVWFPEGYWAERERPESSPRERKTEKVRKWFQKPQDRPGGSLSASKEAKGNKTPPNDDIPQIRIGGMKAPGSSSRESQTTEDRSINTDTPGSKIKRGLQFVSLTHPHFTSPTGQPEGLYCKFKRNFEITVINKPQMVIVSPSLKSESSPCLSTST